MLSMKNMRANSVIPNMLAIRFLIGKNDRNLKWLTGISNLKRIKKGKVNEKINFHKNNFICSGSGCFGFGISELWHATGSCLLPVRL
jgi:hypothetical protein